MQPTEIHVFLVQLVHGLVVCWVSIRLEHSPGGNHATGIIQQIPLCAVPPPRLDIVRYALDGRHWADEHIHGLAGGCGVCGFGPFLEIFGAVVVSCEIQLEMLVRSDGILVPYAPGGGGYISYFPYLVVCSLSDNGIV